jgi:outer membrane immunogenic protein
MKKYALLSAGLLFAGSAYAANLPLPAPAAPPPTPNWDGVYFGANGGGVWGDATTKLTLWSNSIVNLGGGPAGLFPGVPTELVTTSNNRFHDSGSAFGGQFGYLTHTTLVPPLTPPGALIVAGWEVGFDALHLRGSVVRTATSVANPGPPPLAFAFGESVNSDWMWTLMERGGILLGDWYPYLTAGFAAAKFNYNNTYLDNTGLTGTASLNGFALGGGIGGGLEWRWNRNWSVRGQYVYYLFDGAVEGNSTVLGPASTFAIFHHQVTFREGMATGAINYRLGEIFDLTKWDFPK